MCFGQNTATAGKQTVTVTYQQVGTDTIVDGSKTITYALKVTGIKSHTAPTKTTYKIGENFDPSGLSIVFYDGVADVEKRVVWSDQSFNVTGFDSSKEGTQSMVLTYTDAFGKTHTLENAFKVTIEKANLKPSPSPNPGSGNGGGTKK